MKFPSQTHVCTLWAATFFYYNFLPLAIFHEMMKKRKNFQGYSEPLFVQFWWIYFDSWKKFVFLINWIALCKNYDYDILQFFFVFFSNFTFCWNHCYCKKSFNYDSNFEHIFKFSVHCYDTEIHSRFYDKTRIIFHTFTALSVRLSHCNLRVS